MTTKALITVNVRGTRAVERTLRQVGPKVGLALTKSTVSAVASEVMKNAKKEMKFTGRYTKGRMRKATKKRVRRVRGGVVQNDIVVNRRAFYWRFWEYGDGDVPRRAMFGKAVKQIKPVLAHRFEVLFMKKFQARLARERRKAAGP